MGEREKEKGRKGEIVVNIRALLIAVNLWDMHKIWIWKCMISLQAIYLQLQWDERHPRICTCSVHHMAAEEEDKLSAHCSFPHHSILCPLPQILFQFCTIIHTYKEDSHNRTKSQKIFLPYFFALTTRSLLL